jgi:hypothetical protein
LRPGVSGEGLNPLNDTQAIGIDTGVLPFDSIFDGENDL